MRGRRNDIFFNIIVGIVAAIIVTKLFEKNQEIPGKNEQEIVNKKNSYFKKIVIWIILYLIVINLTGAVQGILGGVALITVGKDYYLLAKFLGALIVYTGIVFLLIRKYSILETFKILSFFYFIAFISRIASFIFISNTDTQIMNIYSASSYIFLSVISFTIFFANKKKIKN